jgi:lysophospholipase L1-like esterase
VAKILCYGDSNTFGFDAESGDRFPEDVRWPAVMAARLGGGVTVIEEGFNGRTIHDWAPSGNPLNGTSYLLPCIERHNPLDLIIFYLGINDLFLPGGMTVRRICRALENLILTARGLSKNENGLTARILIIAPPPVNPEMRGASYYGAEIAESRRFAGEYRKVSEVNNCSFIDAGSVVEPITLDGVHLDSVRHRRLGAHVAAFVKALGPS